MEQKCDIGVLGLAVMGQNLVLNIEQSGYRVAGYNRTTSVTEEFASKRAQNKNFYAARELSEFVDMLKKPRKIILMVKAGNPVDLVIESLLPLLEEGDIIIDGGNSFFKDTDRRYEELQKKGIRYLGTGISGGEYGALHGPSIMPGGDESAYRETENILQDVAAHTENGPCVAYLGPRSAGHYVKMVHNGIEYGIMEIISEIYDILRKVSELRPPEMVSLFEEWNKEHQAYLVEITAEILDREDPETKSPLIDVILDRAKQKGTGKWSAREGLNLGIPVPTISAGVKARFFSALKDERITISKKMGQVSEEVREISQHELTELLKEALFVGIITSYAEGLNLLQAASDEYDYNLDLVAVSRIWEDGCIIRSAHLEKFQQAFNQNEDLINIIIAPQIKKEIKENIGGLRKLVSLIKPAGVPLIALSSALDYIDSFSAEKTPANMIQAQRDYFGAHTYERVDREGTFHTEWQDIHNI